MTMQNLMAARHTGQGQPYRVLAIAILAGLTMLSAPQAQAELVREGHVQTELVSENVSIQPGQPFWVALRLVMDEEWDVNWRNAG